MQLQSKYLLTALLAISLISPAHAKGDHDHNPKETIKLLSSTNALYVIVGVPFLHSLFTFLNTENDGKPAQHSVKNLMSAFKKCFYEKSKKSAMKSVIQELKYFYFDGLCKPLNKPKKSNEHKHSDDADHDTCDHDHSDTKDESDKSNDSSVSVYGWIQKNGKPFLLPIIITAKVIDETRLIYALGTGNISLLQFFTESVGVGGDPLKPSKTPSCC